MIDSPPPVVHAQSLAKTFKDFWRRPNVNAVHDLSFTIQPGEIFGLLGPNGSGKSTTIKMILGLLHPTRGRLTVLQRSPRDVRVKQRIGYLPEESYLYPYLTSEETLDFFGRLFDLAPSERRERTRQLLDMIGLSHARKRTVDEFSKGMARRIGLAQALINDPDLVILDEPTSGLDPLGCRQIKDLILTLARRGKTVLMTSHLLSDVEDICDRVAILYNGRLQALGTVDELLEESTRYRLTLPPTFPPRHLPDLQSRIADLAGEPPHLDHPRRDLEQFFLDVIQKARSRTEAASGVAADKGLATYLSQPTPETTPEIPPKNQTPDEALARLLKPKE